MTLMPRRRPTENFIRSEVKTTDPSCTVAMYQAKPHRCIAADQGRSHVGLNQEFLGTTKEDGTDREQRDMPTVSTCKPFGNFQIPPHWEDKTSERSGTRYGITGVPSPKKR
jgi:hypothetical protein